MAVTDTLPAENETQQEAEPAHQENHRRLMGWMKSPNLANDVEDDELARIGMLVKEEYDIDENSRSEWLKKSEDAMKLAMQVAETKTYPWPNASNIIYPLMTIAAIQFASRAYPEVISGRDVVKGRVVGEDKGIPLVDQSGQQVVNPQTSEPMWIEPPGGKRQRADRIGGHMSWQFTGEMDEWEDETDRLLHILPIVGCCFRKSYFESKLRRNCSDLVLAKNLVINYWAKSMERAPRISEDIELYPSEIKENELAELFLKHEYGTPEDSKGDDDAPHEFIEQHRRLDLDKDGYPEPYIVTVHKQTAKVVRIRARYDEDGVLVNAQGEVRQIKPVHYYTKYDFFPNIEGGIYGMGFGQLLGPINEAVNSTINMLLDAGHLQNAGGGFIGRGMSMHSGSVRFKPFEYKVVNAPGSRIRDAIVTMDFKGPSEVLFALLGTMIEAGKDISNTKDVLTGDVAAATMAPTTLMALIDQGMKVYNGIYKRYHRCAGHEYDKIYRLNRLYLNDQQSYQVGNEWKTVTREDYEKGSGVEPVSDPAMVSSMLRMVKAQFLLSLKGDPTLDTQKINRTAMEAVEVPDIDEYMVKNPGPDPALIIKGMELELEGISKKAKAIKDVASAVLDLAKADSEAASGHLDWVDDQLNKLRTRIETLDEQPGGTEGPGRAGIAGLEGPGLP